MATYNPTLIVDEHRWLKVSGCYARLGSAAVAVLVEMRRERHELESLWIDLGQNAGRMVAAEMCAMASEGRPLVIGVVKAYHSDEETINALIESGYRVESVAIEQFVLKEESAKPQFAPR